MANADESSSVFAHQDWGKSVTQRKRLDRLNEKSMFAYPTWTESFSNEKAQIPVTKNWDQFSGMAGSNFFNDLLKKPTTTNNSSSWNQFSGISALSKGGKTRVRKSKRTKKTKRTKKSRRHKK
jgi:hypothetical protein